jgi:hypothetical protein
MAGLFEDFNPMMGLTSNQQGFVGKTVGRGSLISFKYPFSCSPYVNTIHDPYPLIIITDVWSKFIRGVNLHYLTFPYIKMILQNNGENTGFSYYQVKPDKYIANAFRMYYRIGMSQVKRMDSEFLVNLLQVVRSWDPSEMEAIKQQIRTQIKQKLQVKADQLTGKFTKSQNDQLRQKTNNMKDALLGGAEKNLIYPQTQDGLNPANIKLPTGGQFSTEEVK